ncbi:MAG: hypothetical protein AAGH42_02765 [Pseudomonadota bacterium]
MTRFRHFLVVLAFLQAIAPSLLLPAASADADVSAFLCARGTVPQSAALDAFAAFIAQTPDEDEPQAPHCPDCFATPFISLPQAPRGYEIPSLFFIKASWHLRQQFIVPSPTGPPLGGRAPPAFS